MREVVILQGARTPFGRGVKGSLKDTRPDDLGIHVLRGALSRSGVAPADIEDVVLGCAFPEAEQGMNVARLVAVGAGLPVEVPAMTINRFCSSGVQAAAVVADRIAVGQIDFGIAGGLESMSMIPMTGAKVSLNPRLVEEQSGLFTPMGVTAENVARRFQIARAEQDEFAYQSHQKAVRAQQAGFFDGEILPIETSVFDDSGKARSIKVDRDELPRADTDAAKLSGLRPAFDPTGSVTPGNSSPLTDGAAALVMAAKDKVGGRPFLGYFRGFAVAGVPPEIMGIGPVPAVRKLLAKTGLTVADIDVWELNEAFASQAIYCARELGVPSEKLNVNGGAIAIGHPLGATGARMTLTALRELGRRGGRYGIISMCIGGGMGAAALVERA
ncbi:MAG TPA: thiolase family protein [Pseudomonadota bacterium]|jgi:acetyl-CoA acyltransferase|nr:thiolase family protein [Pseudomonadota bacterium]HND12030.1 thiolase family protein [Pseudomonadota bacterium]HNF95949.1 thiolase family protein [Pseudomonadota bacterium]HNK45328.1 thiolase family protein [Pseudomonadota bacterium]HNN49603.1 thiolase family protein [Pseudomonadota bacterium]